MSSKKRALLIKIANELFYKNGFHATGIDTLLEVAGVAKMTLYNHFSSKEDLISKALEVKSKDVLNWLSTGLDNHAVSERDKLFTIFDIYEQWFKSDDFLGCQFAKAAAEFPDTDHPVHKQCSKHLSKLFEMLLDIATNSKVNNPNALAEQIVLLLEGASSVAFSTGATISARRAKRTVIQLIR
jgi:AcrR family transcriptional regulator